MTRDIFPDRRTAGRLLGELVAGMVLPDPVVLGLPRGGVPVAVEVADRLQAPCDVLVVRKIGVPWRPELGVGAIAEGGAPIYDPEIMTSLGLDEESLAPVAEQERAELTRRVRAYRGDRPLVRVSGRDVVLADDGLATGGSARAGLAALRARGPRRLVLAVPVAPPETIEALRPAADDIVALLVPTRFQAVGLWYEDFAQLTDDDVVRLLQEHVRRP